MSSSTFSRAGLDAPASPTARAGADGRAQRLSAFDIPKHRMLKASEQHFQQRLKQAQKDLMHAASRSDHDGRSADGQSVQDIGDQAARFYTMELTFLISDALRKRLQLVNEALERLREGAFGACVTCGEELNPKRLEAVPWACYCIHCQERAEMAPLAKWPSRDDRRM
jgi:DnaK suppressor protein